MPKESFLSASDIASTLDFFDGCSESRACALTPKAHYGNGLHGVIDISSVKIKRNPVRIADRPITSMNDLFRDESIVRRVCQYELACCKALQAIASNAIFAAKKLFDSDDENISETIYSMEGRNESDSKHQVFH